MNRFELLKTSKKSKARLGVVHTDHGDVTTPIFMPVGTEATVKAVTPAQLKDIKAEIILANTYHLYLRPTTPHIAKAGGIHKFMAWDGPVLTDSGGFQVWSLKDLRKITPEGVEFRSILDGSKHFFSPASVMNAQREIGADIIMALDECTPYPSTAKEAEHSLKFTLKWTAEAMQWLKEHPPIHGYDQQFFGIIQGGMHKNLRQQAIERIAELGPDGFAMGGLSVGEPTEVMYEMIEIVNEILPEDRPRYLMGVGTPANMLEAIDRGVDMMDCVMPTRNGRNGMLFTQHGIMNMRNKKWADDFSPLQEDGASVVDHIYSKAYVRHLFIAGELLAMQIASIHNLAFYLWLMGEARQHIIDGDFKTWKTAMVEQVTRRL